MIHHKLPKYAKFPASLFQRFKRHDRTFSNAESDTAEEREKIYIDTSTLLHDHGLQLLHAFAEYGQKHLLLLTSVIYELSNVAKKHPEKATRCYEVLTELEMLHAEGVVQLVRSNSPEFSDAEFLSRFIVESSKNEIVLITQDIALSEKTIQLKSYLEGCVTSHPIRVYHLTMQGDLIPFKRKEVYHENNVLSAQSSNSYPAFQCKAGFYPHFYAAVESGERQIGAQSQTAGNYARSHDWKPSLEGWAQV